MAKLIIRPSQCAARVTDNPPSKKYCSIDGSVFLPCPSMFDFPTKCPLQDGMTHEQFIEQQKPNIIHVKRKSKKRNRYYCSYYLSGTMSKNNCTNGYFQIIGSMVYPKCKGVNCGYYQTK